MISEREIRRVDNKRDDYMVYKWKPDIYSFAGDNYCYVKDTNICVEKGSMAIVYLNSAKGTREVFHLGPSQEKLFDAQFLKTLPLSARIKGLVDCSAVEIYFFRFSNLKELGFGVPYFRIFVPNDRRTISIAVRGNIKYMIPDNLQFLAVNDVKFFNYELFKKNVREKINTIIRKTITEKIDLLDISSHSENAKFKLSEMVKDDIGYALYKEYAISLEKIDILEIEEG